MACIFCIPIMWVDAVISAMPAMPFVKMHAVYTLGKKLVQDCLVQGAAHGFGVLQFNAVVASNIHARHLYERLGFVQLGVIPKGFRMKDGSYEDICPYYHELG